MEISVRICFLLLFSSILGLGISQFTYEGHLPIIQRFMSQTASQKDIGISLAYSLRNATKGSFLSVLQNALSPIKYQTLGSSTKSTLKFASESSMRTGVKLGPQCLADTMAYVKHLNLPSLTEWSLRMADATGKPSAGILSGSFLFLGDFDECMAVKANYSSQGPYAQERKFTGQYCLGKYRINLQPIPPEGNYQWALCVPDSCTETDAVEIGNLALKLYNISLVQFESMVCHEKHVPWTAPAIGVFTMVGVIAFLVMLGTVLDIALVQVPKWRETELQEDLVGSFDGLPSHRPFSHPDRGEDNQWTATNDIDRLTVNGNRSLGVNGANHLPLFVRILIAFSAWTNAGKLLNTNQPPGTLACVNGIRVISINWVVLGHTVILLTYVGDNIGAYSQKALKRWTFQVIINGTFSVDTFFVLSGLLVSYLTLSELKRSAGKLNWLMFYVHRYLRLTPVYMIILGMWVCTLPYLIDGPVFPQKTGYEADPQCRNTWWGNLLYVQNLVKFKPTYCFGWAWYLAVDMQFYLISPLLIVPLYHRPKIGYVIACLFFLMTTITPFVLSETRYYPAMGTKVKGHPMPLGDQNYDLYIAPYCRMGPYLMGMLCGFILYRINRRRIRIHWALVCAGWGAALATGLAVVYGLISYSRGAEMNLHVASIYNALSRTVWGMSVAWVIFSCVTGHGGVINTFLSWSVWVPLARLTYVVYLIHIIVLVVWGSTTRAPFYITDMTVILVYLATLIATYGLAFVISLLFESPVMTLEKLLLKKDKRS
ncbi:nose resistant to fluoxetine protein 6-like [Plakobranchus ocellatus]|uniref:Nose resistant to fluoxetine protein 6-like n=1 Tax=Plakobranchus ocellatus TaxID=259542 RepID=A0AAV4DHI0_9GAST|nr:nose resistant to fluoxetine protein 6-like [Plakobranchus ocellatus]